MAGAGYKLFNTGDVLTAAQVNTYLQEQAVMRFASATARTTALSGVLAEGMVSYLMDTNAVEVYDGSAWVGIGNVGDITGVTAGTGISGGGTSGTVTVTNAMATEITAAGDIIIGTGSGTFDNLPIGTTGQVLTADTTVSPYKVKWASAGSSGALTLITTASLGATTNVNNCFTSTYANYVLAINIDSATTNADINFRLRASGTDTTTNYDQVGDSVAADRTYVKIIDSCNSYGFAQINVSSPQRTEYTAGTILAHGLNTGVAAKKNYSTFDQDTTTAYDGFTIYSSATLTGTVRVYGYANS